MQTLSIAAAALAVSVYLAIVVLLVLKQRKFVFRPDNACPAIGDAALLGVYEMIVRTSDGLDLLAWFAPPHNEGKPVVLYLHGNGGHIGYRVPRLAQIRRFGWGVLMLEYRGYGGNPGNPSEAGLTRDAAAAYKTLRTIGIPPTSILLYGESLGTAVAVRLASEAETGPVMLESPYTSILDIGRARFPYVPVSWLLRDPFDLIGRIPKLRVPVLVMTGALDHIVPPAMGRAVFAAANEPKRFWLAPNAGHADLLQAGAFDAARAFVEEYWKA